MAGPGDPRSPREPADPLNVNHLLLIGAYRDNEASGSHPLVRKLNAIRQAGGRTQEVPLRPLAQGDLGQLIADAVPCAPEQASGLAELVREKTAGNPLSSSSSRPPTAADCGPRRTYSAAQPSNSCCPRREHVRCPTSPMIARRFQPRRSSSSRPRAIFRSASPCSRPHASDRRAWTRVSDRLRHP
jgi:hypothetical protein